MSGNVTKHQNDTDNGTFQIQNGGAAVVNDKFPTVPGNQHGVVGQPDDLAGGEHFLYRIDAGLARSFVDNPEDVQKGVVGRFRLRPAGEIFGNGVHQNDAAFPIRGDHGIPDAAQGDGQAFFLRGQLIGRPAFVRDVPHRSKNAALAAYLYQLAADRPQADITVFDPELQFHVANGPIPHEGLSIRLSFTWIGPEVYILNTIAADHFFTRITGGIKKALVDV